MPEQSTNKPYFTPESTAAERQKQRLKREGLSNTNPSYLLYRELVKYLYAYGVVRRLDRPETQSTYLNGLAILVMRANSPANTDRIINTSELNPGGMEGETLSLLQSLGVLDDIPIDIDVISSSSHDPEKKFDRLRHFPKDEQQKLERELESKIETLSSLVVLRDIAINKSRKLISKRIHEFGEYSQRIMAILKDKGIIEVTDNAIDKPWGPNYLLKSIPLSPDEARTQFFKVLHEHPDIYLPPDITFVPIIEPE